MKWGLGDSYDRVEYLPVKIRAYLDLMQPASTLGLMTTFALASVFYYFYMGEPSLIYSNYQQIIYATFTIGISHGASQTLNMAEDAEIDKQTEHKENRPIPAGIVSVKEARAIAWVLIAVALFRGFVMNMQFGVMVSVALFFGVFYNVEPIRAKEKIYGIPWQAISRGLIAFPLVWSAYGNLYSLFPWVIGVVMFFYVLAYQNSADIIDKDVDREHGISTFVAEFGIKRTVYIGLGSLSVMVAVVHTAIESNLLPRRYLILLAVVPYCLYMSYCMYQTPEQVTETTGNHPAYLMYYLGFLFFVALPLYVEL
jgi:4-hydroxybenzoate polyprenyltransferase